MHYFLSYGCVLRYPSWNRRRSFCQNRKQLKPSFSHICVQNTHFSRLKKYLGRVGGWGGMGWDEPVQSETR